MLKMFNGAHWRRRKNFCPPANTMTCGFDWLASVVQLIGGESEGVDSRTALPVHQRVRFPSVKLKYSFGAPPGQLKPNCELGAMRLPQGSFTLFTVSRYCVPALNGATV